MKSNTNEDFDKSQDIFKSMQPLDSKRKLALRDLQPQDNFRRIMPEGFEEKSSRMFSRLAGEEEENFCGDYVNDFIDYNIDYAELAKGIKAGLQGINGFYFDYRKYRGKISGGSSVSQGSPLTMGTGGSSSGGTFNYFTFSDENGETRYGGFENAKLNKRICYVTQPRTNAEMDGSEIVYTLNFPYKGVENIGEDIPETPSIGDLRRKVKYTGISLQTSNIDNYLGFISIACDQFTVAVKRNIIEFFHYEFTQKQDSDSDLKTLYLNAPRFVLDTLYDFLGADTLLDHFQRLVKYDTDSMFLDASSSLINVMKAFGRRSTNLFNALRDKPTLVKTIYNSLSGNSVHEGQPMSNQLIFAYVLSAICADNEYKGLWTRNRSFFYGSGYKFDGDVLTFLSDEKDYEFYLQQFREITMRGPMGMMGMSPFSWDIEEDLDKGDMYKPMEIVSLSLLGGEETITIRVPAILIKALSDEDEWQDIEKKLRIGFDIIALIAGVAMLATGNPLLFAMAVADISLAGIDLTVQALYDEIMKLKYGPEFLKAWEQIYLVGGILTAGPTLFSSLLKTGNALLKVAKAAKSFNTVKFAQACLQKVILQLELANFTSRNVKTLQFSEEALKASGAFDVAAAMRLEEQEVIFIRALDAENKETGMLAFYKNQIIASGKADDVNDALKEVMELKGPAQLAKLESMAKASEELFEDFVKGTKQFQTDKKLAQEAFALYLSRNWKALENLIVGRGIKWPPMGGGFNLKKVTLNPGDKIILTRYGGRFKSGRFKDLGKYVSPKKVKFDARALPDSAKKLPYREYEIVKPLDATESTIIPWFGKKGLGIQYKLEVSIEKLLAEGKIKLKE